MRVEVIKIADISEEHVSQWRSLQALTPEFQTPLVGPDFACFVARHRAGARVAIAYVNDIEVAYFPFHPTSSGFARGIGAPFCDYQAVVSNPGVAIDGSEFLAKAGIASFAFTSLIDPHAVFNPSGMSRIEGYRIACEGTIEQRLETIRLSRPKLAKETRRRLRKLESEVGVVRFVGDDLNLDTFNTIMDLKSAQYTQNGLTDVLRPPWVKAFMKELFETRGSGLRGCLMTLYAGDKIIAGMFGVRQGTWYHPWITSKCPKHFAFAPGILLLTQAIKLCDDYSVTMIDLAEGHGHYKSQFCREPIIVLSGILGAKPRTAPAQGPSALAIINRRLDFIAAVEPDFRGRLIALSETIIGVPRRLAARKSHIHGD